MSPMTVFAPAASLTGSRKDMQQDRDAELSAADADQTSRRTDDDAGQKSERAISQKRLAYRLNVI